LDWIVLSGRPQGDESQYMCCITWVRLGSSSVWAGAS